MSSSGSLRVGNVNILTCINNVPDFCSLIFSNEDKYLFYSDEEGNPIEEKSENIGHWLLSNCLIIKHRLQILGYTESKLEQIFSEGVLENLFQISKTMQLFNDNIEIKQKIYRELLFWENLTFQQLKIQLTLIVAGNITFRKFDNNEQFDSIENYLIHTISDFNDDLLISLPFNSYLFSLLFVVSCTPNDTDVVFDYTDLYNGGYVGDTDIIIETDLEKIIIITEGVSDIAILKPSLKLLYPVLSKYYSFFDFSSFNSMGSASSLVHIVKAFAGAGISNRVIAIFDNDTAANEARKQLRGLTFPNHIKIINYPDLKFAENYPTVSSTGLFETKNVNGLACSIEMYLGDDIIKDINGLYTPIQWKGFSIACSAYQGEIMNKKEIQKKFFKKLRRAQKSDEILNLESWSGLYQIFTSIFAAFSNEEPMHFH